ncbi:hypothetical protein Celaphus_00008374 [Cervus elaphus hippelaphus]|uniref:Uncharacterized protein n=1 Tax=Cervus elaphus hippelaphus TaxID=46360 RepID=A0A212CPC5_CEREH|nr:hypothetical protein Celaphus_00008374 [Cervus elaphus hippelaphus]
MRSSADLGHYLEMTTSVTRSRKPNPTPTLILILWSPRSYGPIIRLLYRLMSTHEHTLHQPAKLFPYLQE